MKNLRFEIVSDRDKAYSLWENFSPHKVIDDEWNFRDTWTQSLEFPFHFIVGYEGNTPVGLLPLQLNTLKGLGPKLLQMDEPFLEFFGGVDIDDNNVFVEVGYEDTIPLFLEQIKTSAILTSLIQPYKIGDLEATFYLDRYQMELNGISDFRSYIDLHYSGKTRRNILSELKEKRFKDYEIEVKSGTQEDLHLLFGYSISRFGDKSSFNMEYRRQVYKDFYKHFNVDLFIITLNGEPKAAVYTIIYNNIYVGINTGYDYTVPNLGKLIFTTSVSRGIEKGCKLYDIGQGSSKWKEQLHLPKIPQYKLVLNV